MQSSKMKIGYILRNGPCFLLDLMDKKKGPRWLNKGSFTRRIMFRR